MSYTAQPTNLDHAPTRAALRAGLILDVKVGETLTIHPSADTRTIVVRVMSKGGRRTKLRVQSTHPLDVSTTESACAG